VGALKALKKDMSLRRNALLKAIVDEVERRMYQRGHVAAADAGDPGASLSTDMAWSASLGASMGASLEEQLAAGHTKAPGKGV
jgi:hypothetical protein